MQHYKDIKFEDATNIIDVLSKYILDFCCL